MDQKRTHLPACRLMVALACASAICLSAPIFGCAAPGVAEGGTTAGPAYTEPDTILTSAFDEAAAVRFGDCAIDASTAPQGYIGARGTAASRLKLQVTCGQTSYNYDLPADGAPICVPLNMGDGSYTFRIMQNTSGNSYVEVGATSADVQLADPFAPYLRPNVFCDYTPQSACVAQARQLAAGAQNQGEVVRSIYEWMVGAIAYDDAKAAGLADATGYVPDPDETLSSGSGICFDYASLAAAMFRSLGLPCQIVTGYVSPGEVYHAWNMIYIDGEWMSAEITVEADRWCRIDLTLAAAQQGNPNVGDGETYTDRFVY